MGILILFIFNISFAQTKQPDGSKTPAWDGSRIPNIIVPVTFHGNRSPAVLGPATDVVRNPNK